MKKYIAWCCDYRKDTGEGLLARKFVKKYFKNHKIKIFFPKKNFFLKNYLYAYFGIIILWFYYLTGKKTIYINYLPLWNFPIFIFCPPKTIFGPITGSIQINKINSLKSIIRLILFPIFYKISLIILNLRCKKILFATNILKKFLNKNILKKSLLNFILIDFKAYKKKFRKKYDLIIYFRKHENKFFSHHFKLINDFINKDKKILVIGDVLKINGVNNHGRVKRTNLINLIKLSKFSLSGDDNVLSLFNLECLKHNVKVIYNKKLNFQIPNNLKKKFFSYNFDR
jgi:hypothetical protein